MVRYGIFFSLILAISSTSNTLAQLGSEQTGRSDLGQPAPETSVTSTDSPYWIEADNVLAIMPKTRKIVAGYSIEKGTWDRVHFKDPLPSTVRLVVGNGTAAFQTEDSIYAFSSIQAKWARLQVPKTKHQFTIDANLVKYRTPEALYLFSNNTGEWTGTSMETGKPLKLQ